MLPKTSGESAWDRKEEASLCNVGMCGTWLWMTDVRRRFVVPTFRPFTRTSSGLALLPKAILTTTIYAFIDKILPLFLEIMLSLSSTSSFWAYASVIRIILIK